MQVAKHVFEQCLRGPLLRGRTVLLCTNQLQFVSRADYIVVLANDPSGPRTVAEQGSFAQLMAPPTTTPTITSPGGQDNNNNNNNADQQQQQQAPVVPGGSFRVRRASQPASEPIPA